jgi:DNA-directed RNA polymerase specialized sigma24 family protein
MDRDGQARSGNRESWTLTPKALDGLLAALDPDRDRAAVAYERLRVRLIGLIRWWGASQPEELADETLDRVARKLEQGVEVGGDSLGAYVRGVARMVFYEWTRRPRPERAALEVAATAATTSGDDHETLAHLDRCLAELTASDRALLLRYYGEGRSADVRRRLADELGLSPTGLRVRAHRLRARIETALKRSPDRTHPYLGDREGEAE